MNKKYKHKKCILDIKTEGYNPWDGRIICIGFKNIETSEIKVFYEDNEETLLVEFLQYFNKNEFNKIIGFNISYDIRFIIGRCLRYKIPINGFYSAYSTDLMMLLKNFKKSYNFNRPGTLDEWARCLLGKGKLMKKASVLTLYQHGRIDEILEYNKNDVEITYGLWKRLNFVLGGVN